MAFLWVLVAVGVHLTESAVLATLALLMGLARVGFWFLNALIVPDDGMRLNQLNYVKWQDIQSAKRLNIFGMKYLKVSQSLGFSWWIPLYCVGNYPLVDTLNSYSQTITLFERYC